LYITLAKCLEQEGIADLLFSSSETTTAKTLCSAVYFPSTVPENAVLQTAFNMKYTLLHCLVDFQQLTGSSHLRAAPPWVVFAAAWVPLKKANG